MRDYSVKWVKKSTSDEGILYVDQLIKLEN